MSHAAAQACTQRLAAGRVDGYQVTESACSSKRPSTGWTCCTSCGSSGEAASMTKARDTRTAVRTAHSDGRRNDQHFGNVRTATKNDNRLDGRLNGPDFCETLPHDAECPEIVYLL